MVRGLTVFARAVSQSDGTLGNIAAVIVVAGSPSVRQTAVSECGDASTCNVAMPPKRRNIGDALHAYVVMFPFYRQSRLLDHDHAKWIVLGALTSSAGTN